MLVSYRCSIFLTDLNVLDRLSFEPSSIGKIAGNPDLF